MNFIHSIRTALILMLMYIGAGLWSIQLGSLNGGNLAVMWLASGIGLIIMIHMGRIAPYLVFLSSFAVNTPFYIGKAGLDAHAVLLIGLATALIDMSQSLIARNYYQQFAQSYPQENAIPATVLPRYWLQISLIPAAFTSPLLVLLQHHTGLMHHAGVLELGQSMLSLTLSDTAGILLLVPVYQSWLAKRLISTLKQAWLPLLGLTLFLLLALWLRALMILVLPIMLYIAVRYLQAGVGLALLLMSQLCVIGTAQGYGQFASGSTSWAFFNLQIFIFATMLTLQYLASMQLELKQRYQALEYEIALRTEALTEANGRLLEQATTDELTQVPNRREWQRRCAEAIVRSRRYKDPLSIIMLDIDHFKRINDEHGHLAGDLLLKCLSQRCSKNLREIDTFARWGGEEFVILLPETDEAHALIVAEKLRHAVGTEPILSEGQTPISITISLGVTSLSMIDLTLDDLLRRADEALYAAKSAGRNCAISYAQLRTHFLHADPDADPNPEA
ncbi:diguanylate cyclase [Chitinibacter sp. FCG-7]|uniref:diguanylate cyclase n=1 Tax=Chitinibacter mangrovi TaxID=3153927 RepID=A0AAU7F9M1_9NEIS